MEHFGEGTKVKCIKPAGVVICSLSSTDCPFLYACACHLKNFPSDMSMHVNFCPISAIIIATGLYWSIYSKFGKIRVVTICEYWWLTKHCCHGNICLQLSIPFQCGLRRTGKGGIQKWSKLHYLIDE